MKPILYCATSNAAKVREFQHALEDFYEVQQLPGIAGIEPPEETEPTFEGNAALKAVYYSRFTDRPVFADDSGLEVDALGGAPGVYSARYAGEHAGDAANNRLVVERMKGMADRTARFVCVVALAEKGKLVRTFRGSVEGELLEEPRGSEGFGYDPLFFYPPFGLSFGEVLLERKSPVSHRGMALGAMIRFFGSASDRNR